MYCIHYIKNLVLILGFYPLRIAVWACWMLGKQQHMRFVCYNVFLLLENRNPVFTTLPSKLENESPATTLHCYLTGTWSVILGGSHSPFFLKLAPELAQSALFRIWALSLRHSSVHWFEMTPERNDFSTTSSFQSFTGFCLLPDTAKAAVAQCLDARDAISLSLTCRVAS